MVHILLIGLGAGAATALLFASVASGSPISVLLFYLAPLPILIAALGWSHWAALIAAVLAAAGLAAVLGKFFFLAFLIGIGLPAWWLGYLALLARPVDAPPPRHLEWYPVGHLVVWAAIISAAIVAAAMLNLGTDDAAYRAALRGGIERILRFDTGGSPSPTGGADTGTMVEVLMAVLPPTAALLTTLTTTANLWLAMRIVAVSGRLRRPVPDLSAMRFPAYAPALLAAGVAGSFLPALVGTVAGVLAAAMLMAYAFMGFAVVHASTRGMKSRPVLLGGVYAAVLILGWPVLVMTLVGLADIVLDIRGRAARRRAPPNAPTT
jgi:hypothetical protein